MSSLDYETNTLEREISMIQIENKLSFNQPYFYW